MTEITIGVIAGFDVENYGDILFPIITDYELKARLKKYKLYVFSYHEKQKDNWPYEIISISKFSEYLRKLDALIIGGGHIIHFNSFMAKNYLPPEEYMHHPSSFWLSPALICGAKSIPVLWNAVSASYDLPFWSYSLVKAALNLSTYISVRSKNTYDELKKIDETADIRLAPDAVFGIHKLIQKQKPSKAYLHWLESNQISKPYIILHSSVQFKPYENFLKQIINLYFKDYIVVEIPVTPVLGDRPHILDIKTDVVAEILPNPLLVSEIIAHSSCVLAQSLHLSITALSFGIPVIRMNNKTKTKYDFLRKYQSVYFLDEQEPLHISDFTFRDKLDETFETGKVHWDTIANIIKHEKKHKTKKDDQLSRWIFEMPKYYELLENVDIMNMCQWGKPMYFTSNLHPRVKRLKGFSLNEENGFIWTDGQSTEFTIFIDGMLKPANCILECTAFVDTVKIPFQNYILYANGIKTHSFIINNLNKQQINFTLPSECLSDRSITFQIKMPDAKSPVSLSINTDTRVLGLALSSITLYPK